METSAAIYVRRSVLDDREGDNRSLAGQERECLFLGVFLYPQVTASRKGRPVVSDSPVGGYVS